MASASSSGSLRKQLTFSSINWAQQSGAIVLTFYTCLVRLLACCASSPTTEQQLPSRQCSVEGPSEEPLESYSANRHKQSVISRTRSILQNLIKEDELVAILSFPSSGKERGLSPFHKEAALLFFARVYGIPGPELLLQLLTQAFIPDVKLALKLMSVSIGSGGGALNVVCCI